MRTLWKERNTRIGRAKYENRERNRHRQKYRARNHRNAKRVVKHTGAVFFYNMADGGGLDAVNDIIARSRDQVAVPQDSYVLLR